MEYNIDLKKELLATTSTSFRKLLDLGTDAMALYMFYLYTSNNQNNQQCWATLRYVAEGIGWSKDKVAKYNKVLKKEGWIEEIVQRDELGKIKGWYVKVNYRVTSGIIPDKSSCLKTQTLDNPDTGESGQNTPLKSKEQHKKENTPLGEVEVSFNKFWEIFPSRRKTDKTKCRKKWGSLSLEVRNVILGDVPKRVLGEDWTKSNGQYTPAPLSYLNGEKWESSIITPKVFALPQREVIDQAAEFDRTFGKG